MSMNDQRGKTAQPVMPGGAVPGTAVTLPTELTHVEPTKIDEETQQGANTLFFSVPLTHFSRFLRLRPTPRSVATSDRNF